MRPFLITAIALTAVIAAVLVASIAPSIFKSSPPAPPAQTPAETPPVNITPPINQTPANITAPVNTSPAVNTSPLIVPPSNLTFDSGIYTVDYWKENRFRGAVVELGYDINDEHAYPSADSFKQLKSLGANIVNLEVQYLWTMEEPYKRADRQFSILERALDNIKAANLSAIVSVRNGPGRSDLFAGLGEDEPILAIYSEQDAQSAWFEMLKDMVRSLGHRPEIIAWEPMVEPTPDSYFNDVYYDSMGRSFKNSAPFWNDFALRSINAIRAAGEKRPIVIEPVNWGNAVAMKNLSRFEDLNIIYSFHFYDPYEYTHQEGPDFEYDYPGDIGEVEYDTDALDELMAPAVDFARRTGQPILVGEYGGMRFVPDMGDYVSDVVSLFEEHGFSHTYYNWGQDPGWDVDAFNLHYGPNSSNHELALASSTFRPILDSWRKNKGSRQELSPLDDITSFAYVLDNVESNLDAMARSGYDMLVIDNVRSVMDTTGYNMAKAVRKLKSSHSASGGHKIVVAYMNIGEAEDYRWYWQDPWRVGNPEWIATQDPDGWDGNYPVNFWHPKWKAVIYDYMDMIAADGFDGVYLDWIEAYDVDQVANAADAERKDAKKEMIRFVCEIYRKARESGMYVIAQNAAELGAYPEYLSCLDGEGQEAIWFDGSGDPDHGKEGDAKTDPEDTSYYIKALRKFTDAGIPIFSIDYAEQSNNANTVYHSARAQGYISYVTIRSLSALSETPPAGLDD